VSKEQSAGLSSHSSILSSRIVIGLVGQVCAGKSSVSEAFRKRGARIYSADKAVHEIYKRPDVIEQVKEMFGAAVIDSTGHVDRRALGKIVFADEAKLEALTSRIIFPRTSEGIRNEIDAFHKSESPVLLLDAPTLFESGRESMCDRILFVSAPLERRRQWAQARGWPAGELEIRSSRMHDEANKRHKADAVIENNGTLEELDRKAGELLEKWLRAR